MFDDFHDRVEFLGDCKLLPTPLIQRILVWQLKSLPRFGFTDFASLLECFYSGDLAWFDVDNVLGRDLCRLLTHAHLIWKLTILFTESKATIFEISCMIKQRCGSRQDIWL